MIVSINAISKIGDVLFDYVNNSFLASLNMNSMVLVGVYQSLENIIGVLFNLFGGVIADRFRRKKIIILSDFLSGLACIALSFISDNTWLIYMIIAANVFLAFLSCFSTPAYNAFIKEVVEKRQYCSTKFLLANSGYGCQDCDSNRCGRRLSLCFWMVFPLYYQASL
mgnify:FL=1